MPFRKLKINYCVKHLILHHSQKQWLLGLTLQPFSGTYAETDNQLTQLLYRRQGRKPQKKGNGGELRRQCQDSDEENSNFTFHKVAKLLIIQSISSMYINQVSKTKILSRLMHLFPTETKKQIESRTFGMWDKFQEHWVFHKQSNLKNIAQDQVKIISNNTWNLLTICPKPTCHITNCFIIKKWYILLKKKASVKLYSNREKNENRKTKNN